MARYSTEIKNKARLLWLSGMAKSDEEIAAQCGIKNTKIIKKWREQEKWEEDSSINFHQKDKESQLESRTFSKELLNNFTVIDEAIRFLIDHISQGEIKGSFSDLDKLLRLKSFLIEQRQHRKNIGDYEGLSDEELDKRIKATEARIAQLKRKKGKEKKSKK